MGRKRADGDPLGLAGTRLSYKHGAFYYRHRDGRWQRIGTDVAHAKKRAALLNDPSGSYGTVSYWLDRFLVHFEELVKAEQRAPRTLEGYTEDVVPLKAYFGAMLPEDIESSHVQGYLDLGATNGRPVRANRERACLSSCLSWLLRQTGATRMKLNPCMQVSGTVANPESKRDRYVTDEEFQAVYKQAGTQVRLLMDLTYRTLQRPESDIIRWTSTVITRDEHTHARVLKFRQWKTKAVVKIALSPELEGLLRRAMGDPPRIGVPLVHNRSNKGYTYTGIMSMLTAARKKANVERVNQGKAPIPAFGFRDLKGKGATDMSRSGVPVERIQLLCGHANKATTEKYIKARSSEAVEPNIVQLKTEKTQ
jgi:integrase